MERQQSLESELSSKSSSKPKRITFLTLFPEVIEPFLKSSLLGRANESGLVEFEIIQIRDFATDKHRTVDDTPYGGGPGMLLKHDVLYAAWESVTRGGKGSERDLSASELNRRPYTILLSPQGQVLDRALSQELAKRAETEELIFVCGHYEGVDERFIELCVDQEISIGDVVLTGGELPALVVADAVLRRFEGVVGDPNSVTQDSFEVGEGGVLKYPQYTKPRMFKDLSVPEVLLSGNHGEIEKWRKVQSMQRTQIKRPDLVAKKNA